MSTEEERRLLHSHEHGVPPRFEARELPHLQEVRDQGELRARERETRASETDPFFTFFGTPLSKDSKVKLIDFGTAKRFDLHPLTTKARQ